jgi:hypothetical protein
MPSTLGNAWLEGENKQEADPTRVRRNTNGQCDAVMG